jgi:hypothetical protein
MDFLIALGHIEITVRPTQKHMVGYRLTFLEPIALSHRTRLLKNWAACFHETQHERIFTCNFKTYTVRPEALEG